jgi:hypothetical protein
MTSCAENPNEKPFEIRSFFVCGVFSHISRNIKRFQKFMKKVQKIHLKEEAGKIASISICTLITTEKA